MHYGYKHDYKFRNKVFINGKNAKHTKKFKNGKTYNYYYVKGCPYINEKDIEDFVKRQMEKDEERREQKISGLISDLAYELAIGSITKKEFDSKYKTILKNDSRTKWNEKKIYVKAYIENKKKYIEYSIE